MDALISGQLGIAVFRYDDAMSFVRIGAPEDEIPCTGAFVPHLLSGAPDTTMWPSVSKYRAIAELELAWKRDRAVRLMLLLMDPDEDGETRSQSQECLEGLLTDGAVYEFAANQFYSVPLPDEASLDLALAGTEHLGTLARLLHELQRDQARIRECRRAWDRLLDARLENPEAKMDLRARMAVQGIFRKLATSSMDPHVPEFGLILAVWLAELSDLQSARKDKSSGAAPTRKTQEETHFAAVLPKTQGGPRIEAMPTSFVTRAHPARPKETREGTKRIAFVSSFPPRRCGIAVFTSDLIKNTAAAAQGGFEPLVVTMQADKDLKYRDPVRFEIRQNVRSDYICAADYINISGVDLVSVQHEFGLFGGEAGSYLSLLLKRLKAPVVTTLHTVLDEPTPNYHRALVDVCECSHKVVTMNERGVTMLQEIYGIRDRKICLIPHGIPDLPFVDSNYYKSKFGLEGRKTILTFGLISKNKGIEVMLRAMPQIIKTHPSVMYIVLGMTHPAVLKHEGESYRFSLQQLVKGLNLQDHVIFHNRFVNNEELHNFFCAADILVTPYLNREQLTCGTLALAAGTGKAVVSTPYWAAAELLADGRGRLVPFGDSTKLAEAIIGILQDDTLFYSLRRQAYEYGRSRTWPKVGQAYWKLFRDVRLPIRIAGGNRLTAAETISSIEVPEPALGHLVKLTDDTGLLRHAEFTIPNRAHGYCTDDNARGALAMIKYYTQYPDPEALRLLDTYLSFVMDAQESDGSIRNTMSFERIRWTDEPAHDAMGRVLWALGTVMACPPSPAYIPVVKHRFDRSVHLVQQESSRGMAYAILGMCDYLKQFPGASDIKRELELSVAGLVAQYQENCHPDWDWFEDVLTYDNAALPHALFAAGMTLEDEKYIEVATRTADFLLETTFDGARFSFIGCRGWYERGKTRAAFDQQPIDAAAMVMMLRAAYDVTNNAKFLSLQRTAFDWFLGANDLGIPLYDFRTKGCSDGLMANGISSNQGAESTVSFLLSLLSIVESYAIIDRIQKPGDSARSSVHPIGEIGDIASHERESETRRRPRNSVGRDQDNK